MFESGAILLYLADKIGRFIPRDLRARLDCIQWLFWQMANLGPLAGQNHHFVHYAPERLQYAIDRYVNETGRLYAVLNKRLADREFMSANIRSPTSRRLRGCCQSGSHRTSSSSAPEAVEGGDQARPRRRAYALARRQPKPGGIRTEEEKKILFDLTKDVVR
jgi:GST-like protein